MHISLMCRRFVHLADPAACPEAAPVAAPVRVRLGVPEGQGLLRLPGEERGAGGRGPRLGPARAPSQVSRPSHRSRSTGLGHFVLSLPLDYKIM